MKKRPALQDADVQNTLLGDLESIRSLLDVSDTIDSSAISDADDASDASNEDDAIDDVPMLQDMVEGALTVNEAQLASRSSFDDDAPGVGNTGLADATIEALLGDAWRNQAQEILAGARATILSGSEEKYSGQRLDVFNDTLRQHIDRTLDDWLAEVLHARIETLRARLLELLDREIRQLTESLKNTQ